MTPPSVVVFFILEVGSLFSRFRLYIGGSTFHHLGHDYNIFSFTSAMIIMFTLTEFGSNLRQQSMCGRAYSKRPSL